MVKGTLNELPQLKVSGFGQPDPRHGLNLLYWFAHDYINIDIFGDIVPKSSPSSGAFGFHKFENRIEDEDHLLPLQNLPYYEVGNLHARGADKLPSYVREKYNQHKLESNKDRIIVRLHSSGNLERVYVTQHSDTKQFDTSKTYRVSQGLLKIIRAMTREQYLKLLTNQTWTNARVEHGSQKEHLNFTQQSRYERPAEDNSWCTIL